MGRELTLPSTRLTAAAELAAAVLFNENEGEKLKAIDVGCDHAKLSVYLIQSGICSKVLACDVNDGPVRRAIETIEHRKFMSTPLSEYINVIQNDGLIGLENVDANRIFILGMGGELISDIIEKSGFLKDKERKTALILQAMTSEYDLRKYLYNNGFNIVKEVLVRDKGRIYSIILCYYDGVIRNKSETVLILGEYNIANRGELFDSYLERKIKIQNTLVSKLTSAGINSEVQKSLLNELKSMKCDR